MAIAVQCQACKRTFRVPQQRKGQTMPCPVCAQPMKAEGAAVRDFDVFISYSQPDRTAAFQICSALEAEGLACWIAPRNVASGTSWAAAIVSALEQCPVMLLVYSEQTNGSQQVLREVERATAKKIALLPVRLEDAPMAPELEYYLSTPHWFDALERPLEANFPRLKLGIRAMLGDRSAAQQAGSEAQRRTGATSRRPLARIGRFLRWIAPTLLLALVAGLAAGLVWWQKDRLAALRLPSDTVTSVSWSESGNTGVLTLPGGVTMDFIKMPATTFWMGSAEDEPGRDVDEPDHQVALYRDFWIGNYEVTQAQWRAVMGANPSRFEGDDMPVEGVSWDDCHAFLGKVNGGEDKPYRLPSEAEWEMACRAGGELAYCFGDSPKELDAYGWYVKNSEASSHPAGRLKANGLGLYDMYGNVAEWCADWYGPYDEDLTVNPFGPQSGVMRVVRGGAWDTRDTGRLRSAARGQQLPTYRGANTGFRCVRDAQ